MRAGRKRKFGNRQPSGRLSRRDAWAERREGQAAIYIIEIKDGIVKIGYSVCPQVRVKTLEDGQLQPIKLLWTHWMPAADARRVEELVHRKLKKTQCHLKGEMYYLGGGQASEIILAVMRHVGIAASAPPVRPDPSVVGGRYSCNEWLTRLG